ncbi:trans-sialidase, putative [Trypanosoma cruzi]|nr:trans-sialidase, putative [Trypanosoma cruzi]
MQVVSEKSSDGHKNVGGGSFLMATQRWRQEKERMGERRRRLIRGSGK